MPKVKVTASDETPEFLGGPLPPGVDRVPFPDPVFERMPRPPSPELPPLHSKDREFLVDDNGFEEVYMKIFNGDGFWIEWEASPHPDDYHDYEIKISAFDDENAPRGLEEFSGTIICAGVRGGAGKTSTFTLVAGHFYSLPRRKTVALFHRAVHLFVRTMGNSVDEDLVNMIGAVLHGDYCGLKRWNEAVDISVALTDITRQKQNRTEKQHLWWMCRLGEIQGVKNNFMAAGDIFRFRVQLESDAERPAALDACGVAYTRAGNYDAAEEHLVRALHILSTRAESSWDINETETSRYLADLVLLYIQWTEDEVANRIHRNDGSMLPEIAVVEATLYSMLFQLGLKGTGNIASSLLSGIDTCGAYCSKYLTNRMKSRAKAKKSFKYLFSVDDSQHFRSSLMSYCKNAKMVRCDTNFRDFVSKRLEKHNSEEHRAKMIGVVKAKMRALGDGSGGSIGGCANSDCMEKGAEGQFMKCPCRNVMYCGKECQESHWPQHKLVCPVAVAKRQKKARQKSTAEAVVC